MVNHDHDFNDTYYNDLEDTIINFLKQNHLWNRVISLDIEADLRILTDPTHSYHYILSISTAKRDKNGIDIRNFILEDECKEGEEKILRDFYSYCKGIKPLVIIGYGIRRFDLPLLLLKSRQYRNVNNYNDSISRSYFLDLIYRAGYEIAKYEGREPRFNKLDDVINHELFSNLPFKNKKSIVESRIEPDKDKWSVIYDLWKNHKTDFIEYINGDVHDTLLIAEKIFQIE